MNPDETLLTEDAVELITPNTAALIESLRAVGYTLEAAIADIIDNSISANAKNIWIDFIWREDDSRITIIDDGSGMTESQLTEAMRMGSKNPLTLRNSKDLGRFGLGLKTASFSQCRSVTVISRIQQEQFALRRWDLDYMAAKNDWAATKNTTDVSTLAMQERSEAWKTIVLWEKLDFMLDATLKNQEKKRKRFFDMVEHVKEHISMIFHRFLESPKRLRIFINEDAVIPWDPFMTHAESSQSLPKEYVKLDNEQIEVIPHILPHQSKVKESEYAAAEGPRGWLKQQGFYVYRNQRLLVPGSWLGLGIKRSEINNLARIQVDLANTMDLKWQIDIKKSRATPPASITEHLSKIARWTLTKANEAYKGKRIILERSKSSEIEFIWNQSVKQNETSFQINRNHFLIQQCSKALGDNHKLLSLLLSFIESTLPLNLIRYADNIPKPPAAPEELDCKETIVALTSILNDSSLSNDYIRSQLQRAEPFSSKPDLIDQILKTRN